MPINQLQVVERATEEKIILQKPLRFNETAAGALLLYAARDKQFSERLKNLLSGISFREPSASITQVEVSDDVSLLMPRDLNGAMLRAGWLLKRVSDGASPGAREAAALLSAWAAGRVSPQAKQVVVGVVGVAIPGITLGLIKKRKTMMVLIRRDQETTLDIAQAMSQASVDVIGRSLDMANGMVDQLEPSIGEWLVSDRDMTLFAAGPRKMRTVRDELEALGITYSHIDANGELQVLAISPTVNSDQARVRWKLEPIPQR